MDINIAHHQKTLKLFGNLMMDMLMKTFLFMKFKKFLSRIHWLVTD